MFKKRRAKRIAERSVDTLMVAPGEVKALNEYLAAGWVLQTSIPVTVGKATVVQHTLVHPDRPLRP